MIEALEIILCRHRKYSPQHAPLEEAWPFLRICKLSLSLSHCFAGLVFSSEVKPLFHGLSTWTSHWCPQHDGTVWAERWMGKGCWCQVTMVWRFLVYRVILAAPGSHAHIHSGIWSHMPASLSADGWTSLLSVFESVFEISDQTVSFLQLWMLPSSELLQPPRAGSVLSMEICLLRGKQLLKAITSDLINEREKEDSEDN